MKSPVPIAQNSTHGLQASRTAQKIMDAFAKGRQRAIEKNQARSRTYAETISLLLTADALAGRPIRGRAGRIARKMGGALSERHVKRILDSF